MSDSSMVKTTCTQCRKQYSPVMSECPFCGAARDGLAPAAAGPGGIVAEASSGPAFEVTVPASAPEPSEPSGAKSIECESCGATEDLVTIRIESWEDMGYTLTNKHKFRVRRLDAPCYCKSCEKILWRKRLYADMLSVAPLALVIAVSACFRNPGAGPAVIVLAYIIYLARAGSYTWADKLIYGYDLETQLNSWIPSQGKVRFPSGMKHGLLRVLFAFVLPFVALLIVALFKC